MRRLLGALALALAVAGCSSTSKVTGTSPASGQGTMSATINGTSWVAAKPDVMASYSSGLLDVTGTALYLPSPAETTVGFAVNASAPGTYAIDSLTDNNALVMKILQADQGTWMAVGPEGSGSIVISTLTATGASGTFSFVAPAESGSGATGTKTVTNGTFNVTF